MFMMDKDKGKEIAHKCYLNRPPETKLRALNCAKRNYWLNRDRYMAQNRRAKLERKIKVLTYYGNGKCACVKCGFSDIRALSIDHINDDGCEERRGFNMSVVSGDQMYRKLKEQGFPVGYQTLCYNCNIIKHIEHLYKIRHQTKNDDERIKLELLKYPNISKEEIRRRISEAAKRNWANPKIRENYLNGLRNIGKVKGIINNG